MTYRELLHYLVPGGEELPEKKFEDLLYTISQFLGDGDRGLQFPDSEILWDEEEEGDIDEVALQDRLFQTLEEEC